MFNKKRHKTTHLDVLASPSCFEELLRRSQEDLQERRLEMGKFGECQAYWDEMPFISNTSLDEQHAEVMQYHQEVQKLQVELERNESAAKLQVASSLGFLVDGVRRNTLNDS